MGKIAPEKKSSGEYIVTGEVTLDGANPTPVETGFDKITSVSLTLKKATAPGVDTSVVTYGVSGGTLNIYAWKPTSVTNPTLVASTDTEGVSYVVTGY